VGGLFPARPYQAAGFPCIRKLKLESLRVVVATARRRRSFSWSTSLDRISFDSVVRGRLGSGDSGSHITSLLGVESPRAARLRKQGGCVIEAKALMVQLGTVHLLV
jgi:hypothetical protein